MIRPVALITGASAGIGTALAHVFADHGHDLVLIARREQRLFELAESIAAKGGRKPACCAIDLARPSAIALIRDFLDRDGAEPMNLVNNAGFGLVGPASEIDQDEQLAMIDLNVRSLAELSLAFVTSLERHKGGILNVASVAGFVSGPGMAVYYATKAFVLSFSEALHVELKSRGVRVTALCPGPVRTEFRERAGDQGDGYPPFVTLPAERVAAEAYRGFKAGHRLVVPGVGNKLIPMLSRFMPRALQLAAVDLRNRRRRS